MSAFAMEDHIERAEGNVGGDGSGSVGSGNGQVMRMIRGIRRSSAPTTVVAPPEIPRPQENPFQPSFTERRDARTVTRSPASSTTKLTATTKAPEDGAAPASKGVVTIGAKAPPVDVTISKSAPVAKGNGAGVIIPPAQAVAGVGLASSGAIGASMGAAILVAGGNSGGGAGGGGSSSGGGSGGGGSGGSGGNSHSPDSKNSKDGKNDGKAPPPPPPPPPPPNININNKPPPPPPAAPPGTPPGTQPPQTELDRLMREFAQRAEGIGVPKNGISAAVDRVLQARGSATPQAHLGAMNGMLRMLAGLGEAGAPLAGDVKGVLAAPAAPDTPTRVGGLNLAAGLLTAYAPSGTFANNGDRDRALTLSRLAVADPETFRQQLTTWNINPTALFGASPGERATAFLRLQEVLGDTPPGNLASSSFFDR